MSNLLQSHRERVGRQIRRARIDAGLSHDKLAAEVGSSRQHLIRLEKGQHIPRADLLQRIAEATGKDPAFFAQGEDDEEDRLAVSIDDFLRLRVRELIREERGSVTA